MIVGLINNNTIIVDMFYRNRDAITMKVDTGAPITIISKKDISKLLDIPITLVNKKLEGELPRYKKFIFTGYGGSKSEAILCRMTNVFIGDELVNEIYLYLNLSNDKNITPLLGMDFISRCSGRLDAGTALYLDIVKNASISYRGTVLQINELIEIKNDPKYKRSCISDNRDKLFLETSLPDIL